ncbi:MAG: HEAT repeat domain-containing protein [Mailhella sp.]|nr:HEAT repeat domain-containing protein [Mailhella sp.]
MPGFRRNKQNVRAALGAAGTAAGWENVRSSLGISHKELAAALFALLTEGGETARRAAEGMGFAVAGIHAHDGAEPAKNIVRRFIWHMNEESGNAGWGIPVAFAEVLAACPPLAEEYHTILLSYLLDLPGDSNYCDFAPLRSECYDAAELLLLRCPQYREPAKRFLADILADPDPSCREKARHLMRSVYPDILSF